MRSGFAGIKFAAQAVAICGLLAVSQTAAAELSSFMTGNMLGSVVDDTGSPQIGASVQLLNRYQRVLARATTGGDGRFVFAGLPLDVYALRVTQPSFFPAFRDRIIVKAGADSILQIHMATLFSSIQVNYKLPGGTMSDDWKWVLRTSSATRPVTRYLPPMQTQEADAKTQLFSNTHAILRINGGDSSVLDNDTAPHDLGSVFGVSTDFFGRNQLQIAGSYGQASDVSPVRGVAAVYQYDSHNAFTGAPLVTLTMSQFDRFGNQAPGGQTAGLRTMALSIYQTADPLDMLHLEYGATGESVDYLQHSSRLSPFARMTVALDARNEIVAAYSDGGRPDELLSHGERQGFESFQNDELSSAVNALTRLPQMSSRNGELRLQRTQNYELGYDRTAAKRVFSFSGFYERVTNGRLTLAGNTESLDTGDLLSDGISKTSTYNVGGYARYGYTGSVTQKITDFVDLGLSYGKMGGFTTDADKIGAGQSLALRMGMHDVAGADLRTKIPAFGTRIDAGYGWVNSGSVVPVHYFTTQSNLMTPGLNFRVTQPLPSPFGFPGRLELTADLRNLLAQGYIPITAGPGTGQLLVVQSPRAIRGGLAFRF